MTRAGSAEPSGESVEAAVNGVSPERQHSAGDRGGLLRPVRRPSGSGDMTALESSARSRYGAVCYIVVGVAMWVWLPGGHPLDPLLASAAAVAYLVATSVTLRLSHGVAMITQPAFVLMLFVVPLNVIPIAVGVLEIAGGCLWIRPFPVTRLPLMVNTNWFCVAPTALLALGAPGLASWSHWPIYAAAFGAQFLSDALAHAAFSSPAGWEERKSGRVAELLLPEIVDALLTPIGLAVAVIGQGSPGAALTVLAGALGVMVLLAHEREQRLEHQQRALRDSLTGLANRALFEELADAAARRCARGNACGALLMVDLNDFKVINDRYGHLCGDRVLGAFAARLDEKVRGSDTVARLGGDEFAVLLGDPMTIRDADVVAQNLRKAFEVPLDVPELGELCVSASIGAAEFGAEVTPLQAIAEADRAMYAEKRAVHTGVLSRSQ